MAFKSRFLTVFCFTLAVAGGAKAGTVVAGSNYLQSDPGTYFNFDPPVGIVDFTGYAIGPGTTDMIVKRTSDVTINGAPGILQLIALSMVSTAPVALPGYNGLIYISLDPTHLANDTGQITIGGTVAGGTFSSFVDVFYNVCTAPGSKGVGCGSGALLESGSVQLSNSGANWSSTPFGVVVSGPVGDPAAMVHTGLTSDQADFFLEPTKEESLVGQHRVSTAVPEPASWALMIGGFGMAGAALRRRRAIVAA
jgi:hypothetical protein